MIWKLESPFYFIFDGASTVVALNGNAGKTSYWL